MLLSGFLCILGAKPADLGN